MMRKVDTVSRRLRIALDLRGYKQVDLTEKTGLPKSSVSQYLSGSREPKQKAIYLISEALSVSPAWLMGYDAPMDETETPEETMLRKYRALDAFGRDIVDHILDAEYQRCLIAGEKIG